jgi:CPA2 family monovalent cation:H+ antiporter-2
MHIEGGLFFDIVVTLAAAFVGGLSARLLRLPFLLGYLISGMVIGPYGFGILGNVEDVRTLAEFGVILLLFAIGIEISFRELRGLGASVLLIGGGQILVTLGIGFGIGAAFGWLPEQAVVFGLILSLSSTMVVLKTLGDQGELRSLHGKVLTGIMVIQDIAFIPMIAILPALGGGDESFLVNLGIGLGKAAAVMAVIAILGGKAIPWLLSAVARLGSREVFVLSLVAITFIIAAITEIAGLSAALGAFLAGLILSESEFGYRALSEVLPLRDTFSALFFVSLGMLADPVFLANNAALVVLVVAIIVFAKFAVTAGLSRAFGYLPYTAILTGLGIVQIGEFSFILAETASGMGIVDQNFLSLIVVSAVVSMAITPPIMNLGQKLVENLGKKYRFLIPYRVGNGEKSEERVPYLTGHTIICGMGRVGTLVAQSMHDYGLPFIVIDLDPQMVARCRENGYRVIHGSSSSDVILEAARVKWARLVVISTGDIVTTRSTAQIALSLNPRVDIVARVYLRREGEYLQKIGVSEVVWTEMEAGLEILRHSLNRFNTHPAEVEELVRNLRERLRFSVSPESDESLPPDRLEFIADDKVKQDGDN